MLSVVLESVVGPSMEISNSVVERVLGNTK